MLKLISYLLKLFFLLTCSIFNMIALPYVTYEACKFNFISYMEPLEIPVILVEVFDVTDEH